MAKNDYKNWSKDDLVKEVDRLRKRKKYGLVWEDKPEDVVEQCKTELPILDEVEDKEIKTDPDKPANLLIEGDNYHALSVLNYTHKGKVDVIYIDPPYNTGNKSWKYNNHYVDKEDSFRHSKWLSFMAKRLELSKHLLKDSGMIIVTVDDYEIGSLRLLMDEIFGEQNRLGLVTIMHNPRGRSDDLYFASSHEYALAYGRRQGKTTTYKLRLTEEQEENFPLEDEVSRYRLLPLKRTGSNSTPNERPNLFYSIFYKPETNEISIGEKKDFVEIIPLDSNGEKRVWRWGKETLKERKDTEIVVKKGRNYEYAVYAKDRVKGGRKPKTVWVDPKYDASSHGTLLLQKILGKRKTFDYPKSLYAVKDILEIGVRGKKEALILDFFAGSGTTGHAVMELNKEDGGNRKFILSTNNEDNNGEGLKIATDICHPRIKRVIEGYKTGKEKVEGLGGNLKYFHTSFVPADPTDKNKTELTEKATEMLCVREDTFEPMKDEEKFKIFKGKDHYTGIIFDQLAIDDFKKAIAKIDSPFSVYVFSLGDDTFDDEFADVKDKVTLSPIPEAILRVYRRIFK